MISDVLSDAVVEINEYLEQFPEVYKEYLPNILWLTYHMNVLRTYLDLPPLQSFEEESAAFRELVELRTKLSKAASMKGSKVKAVRDKAAGAKSCRVKVIDTRTAKTEADDAQAAFDARFAEKHRQRAPRLKAMGKKSRTVPRASNATAGRNDKGMDGFA